MDCIGILSRRGGKNHSIFPNTSDINILGNYPFSERGKGHAIKTENQRENDSY
jgi:hypothetical protein